MSAEIKNVLTVKTGTKTSYDIYVEESFEKLSEAVKALNPEQKKICIVTDENVAKLYLEPVKKVLEGSFAKVSCFVFPAGEASKNLSTVQDVYRHLIEEHFDRKDVLATLGGGVVGDLTGYAAATYLRGVEFIQIPTTLLAQVDSSIGGKTGVDFDAYKNMVGAFHQPSLVYINLAVLKSLSDEQFSCGMGEVLKHGLIKKADYYEWCISNMFEIQDREIPVLREMVTESLKIKRAVVEKDPTEKGERALLNFGHTVGHAIEKLRGFELLHGQCVALGCLCAAHISWSRGMLSNEEFFEIRDMNVGFDLPIFLDGVENEEEVLKITKSDKKMEHGQIKFILLKSIGRAYIDETVTDDEIRAAVHYFLDNGEEDGE